MILSFFYSFVFNVLVFDFLTGIFGYSFGFLTYPNPIDSEQNASLSHLGTSYLDLGNLNFVVSYTILGISL